MSAYKITEHKYDMVVVGAGGAGLRVALGRVAAGKRRRVGLTQPAVDELAAVALLVETVRHIFVLLA